MRHTTADALNDALIALDTTRVDLSLAQARHASAINDLTGIVLDAIVRDVRLIARPTRRTDAPQPEATQMTNPDTYPFSLREGEWRVYFLGKLMPPFFNSRGAALAYIAGLQKGRPHS